MDFYFLSVLFVFLWIIFAYLFSEPSSSESPLKLLEPWPSLILPSLSEVQLLCSQLSLYQLPTADAHRLDLPPARNQFDWSTEPQHILVTILIHEVP